MKWLETQNLTIRDFTLEDANFVLQLLNEPIYIEMIRDNGVRCLDDAETYIQYKIFAPIKEQGFGYHLISEKQTGSPIGMCGLMKRSFLTRPDLGFAFLSSFQNKGYGYEAVHAYVHSEEVAPYSLIHAFTSIINPPSQKLLLKLGFKNQGIIKYGDTDDDVLLFNLDRGQNS